MHPLVRSIGVGIDPIRSPRSHDRGQCPFNSEWSLRRLRSTRGFGSWDSRATSRRSNTTCIAKLLINDATTSSIASTILEAVRRSRPLRLQGNLALLCAPTASIIRGAVSPVLHSKKELENLRRDGEARRRRGKTDKRQQPPRNLAANRKPFQFFFSPSLRLPASAFNLLQRQSLQNLP